MPLVTWDESYSVRVEKCDEDHRRLFSLINALHDAMLAGKGAHVIQTVVNELADYTHYHFSREESLLEKTRYPALAPHQAQHQEFVKKVEQFRQDLKAGTIGESVFVANFLLEWLTNHIRRSDRQYSLHLNDNGIF
jgi:hemerythrin-like metal-binding protein